MSTSSESISAAEFESPRFRDILDALPVGIFLVDAQGNLVRVNREASIVWKGIVEPQGNVRDASNRQAWRPDTGAPVKPEEWPLARALDSGKPIMDEVVDIRRLDGTRGTILISAVPLFGTENQVIGAVATIQDITEAAELRHSLESSLRNARLESERVAALESIAEAGIATLDLNDLLNTLAERIARGLGAHSCHILILDESGNEFVTLAVYNAPHTIAARTPVTHGFTGQISKEHRTVYVRDAQTDPTVETECIKAGGVRSLLGTPLVARGRVIGVTYINTMEVRDFAPAEIRLFEAMAARASLAIENSRLYDETLKSREVIQQQVNLLQRALLPEQPAIGSGYEVSSVYIPGTAGQEIGGDFYDIFTTSTGKTAILIGDVSGKGIESASLAAATRSTIRAFAYDMSSAREALTHANSVLSSQKPDMNLFVTVFLAILDLSNGTFCYSSAGHPPAAVYRAASGAVDFLATHHPPVGLIPRYQFDESRYQLHPRDRLVFYTDGISEARQGPDLFGTEGIARILEEFGCETPDDLMVQLLDAATNWAGGQLKDDAAVIIIERL